MTFEQIILHEAILFFFFNDTATTEIYTLSLHDALPISVITSMKRLRPRQEHVQKEVRKAMDYFQTNKEDRKSTRLNSSHVSISYAVFCLKKKKKNNHKLTINLL